MAKITLPNSLPFFKKIKKLTLSLTCMSLLTFSAQASMNLKDLTDSTSTFITQKIVQPVKNGINNINDYVSDKIDDTRTDIERAYRPKPSNCLDLIEQKFSDVCEDAETNFERKFVRPTKHWIQSFWH